MKLFVARLLIRFLSLMPLRLLHTLAVPLGALAWYLPSRKHGVIAANLAIAFPDLDSTQRRQLHRAHLIEMIRLVLETGAVWHWSAERLVRHVPDVEGLDALRQAEQEGRGLLILSAHLGNWEILTLFTSLQMPLAGLYRAPGNDRINRAITRSRERFGGQLIASGSPAMRGLLRQLKDGKAAGILVDQQPKQGEGVFVPFFGQPALTMTLAHRLAMKTGCAVFFAHSERLPRGRGWALGYTRADEAFYDEKPQVALGAMHAWLEQAISDRPAQYLWRYKRFGLQPEGAAAVYPARR